MLFPRVDLFILVFLPSILRFFAPVFFFFVLQLEQLELIYSKCI